jgi:hypothetical protein
VTSFRNVMGRMGAWMAQIEVVLLALRSALDS